MATLDELTDEVLSHQFSASQYDSFIRSKLNEAERKLFAEIDFRVGFTLTVLSVLAGYIDYFLPTNYQRIYNVTVTTSDGTVTGLKETPFTELDLLDQTATGIPERYAVSSQGTDNTIRLWPYPDTAYSVRVRYYGSPGEMSDGDDEPALPEQWQSLLVTYALIKCYERENDYNSAQYHQGVFEREKEKFKGQAQYDSDDYSQARQVGDGLAPGSI